MIDRDMYGTVQDNMHGTVQDDHAWYRSRWPCMMANGINGVFSDYDAIMVTGEHDSEYDGDQE